MLWAPACSAHANRCTQFSLNTLEKCPAALCKVRLGWSVFVQSCFEYFQGWRFWKFTGPPELVCKHHNYDLFTLRLEFPSLGLVNIACCPFAVHLQPFWVCLFYKPQKIAEEGNWSPGQPEAISSPAWTNQIPSASPCTLCAPAPWCPGDLSPDLLQCVGVSLASPPAGVLKELHIAEASLPLTCWLQLGPVCGGSALLQGCPAAHVWPVGHQHPQLLHCKAASWPVSSQPVLLPRWEAAFVFVELQEDFFSLFLQLLRCLCMQISPLPCQPLALGLVSCTKLNSVTSPRSQVEMSNSWAQYSALRNADSNQLLARFWTTEYYYLSPMLLSAFHPFCSPPPSPYSSNWL